MVVRWAISIPPPPTPPLILKDWVDLEKLIGGEA